MMANPTGQRRNPAIVNAPSKLLSKSENDQVVNLLGSRCWTLATAVVQVFLAQPPNSWTKRCCGVACFVKDNDLRSYFIRVYDIMNGMQLWEQELYSQFIYFVTKGKPFFHTFPIDTCWAALNFANDAEAGEFSSVIKAKIRAKRLRKESKEDKKRHPPGTPARNRPIAAPPQKQRRSSALPPFHSDTRSQNQVVSPANNKRRRSFSSSDTQSLRHANIQPPSPPVNTNTTTSKKKDKKGKKGKLTKADISTPSDFTHVAHCGWDPEKGLDLEEMDQDVQGWFESLGVDGSKFQDKETMEIINNFIKQNGGINAIKDEVAQQRTRGMSAPPPPPPSRGSAPPPPPPGNRGALPPPPPSRGYAPPLPPSSRGAPPPPPPSRALPPTPPSLAPPMRPPSMQSWPSAAPPPPQRSGGGGPPPPPPPPPPAVGAAPPPPPPPIGGGGRTGLLDDIHRGNALNHVDPNDRPAPANSGHGMLLDQIRGGKALKKVDIDREAEVAPSVPQDGLGAALLNALQMRSNAINPENSDDDSEDDDFDDDDEEWD